jgi:transcriptional regulator with XRE-family HTH domain
MPDRYEGVRSVRGQGSDFGQRLAAIRRERGFTQVQLAEAIGSNQRLLSYYENVADYPPAGVITDIARVLKVSTDELLGVKAIKGRRISQDDPETRRLWKKFQQILSLPEKDRRAVIRLVNSLVSVKAR